jgi:hypothetical protein
MHDIEGVERHKNLRHGQGIITDIQHSVISQGLNAGIHAPFESLVDRHEHSDTEQRLGRRGEVDCGPLGSTWRFIHSYSS